MLRLTKRLLNLPVQTVSGLSLGQAADFEVETNTGRLQKMLVKPSGLVKGLMSQDLVIDWAQIHEIKDQIILVEDSAVKESSRSESRSVASPTMAMASDLSETE